MTSILKVSEIQDPTNSNTALTIDASGNAKIPGSAVQVVEGTAYTSEQTVSASSYTAFPVTASITPKFSNSKIYIICHGSCMVYNSGGADARGRLAISSDSGSSFLLEK